MMPKVIVVGGTGQYSVMKPIIERGGGIITAVFDDVIDCSPDKDVPFYRLNELDEWINREEVCLRDTIRKLCYYFVVAVGNPHAQFRIDTSKMLDRELEVLESKKILLRAQYEEAVAIYRDANIQSRRDEMSGAHPSLQASELDFRTSGLDFNTSELATVR
jgi:hypothetical protein